MLARINTNINNPLLDQKRPNRAGQISNIITYLAYGVVAEVPEKIVSRLASELDEPIDGLLVRLADELEAKLPTLVHQELNFLKRNPHHIVSFAMRDVVKALLWLRQQAS